MLSVSAVRSEDNIPIVDSLEEVLGDQYIKLTGDMCFQYDDSIFDNSKYTNVIINGVKLVDKKPQNNNHGLYRTWQINKPFISNNDISKIDLNEVQKKK